MRGCLLALILGASLAAQTQSEQSKPDQPPAAKSEEPKAAKPDADEQQARKERDEKTRKSLESLLKSLEEKRKLAAKAELGHRQPCAIPLKNVLPQMKDASGVEAKPRMPILKPGDRSQFPMKEVVVPAPSCDDVK